ncbi:MAG: TonB-dependent receptor plug domain-containing protein [Ignavibacteriae bacterium]|nr:TonB-dependent receptor plug domain-containing protein [Ignavibacteriota bacterium]
MKHKLTETLSIALLLISLTNFLSAQIQPTPALPQDSTSAKDSGYIPIQPISLLGSLDRKLSGENILPDSLFPFVDYRYLGDLLSMFPEVYVRDLGSPGQLHGLTMNGVDARSIAVMSDGILLNEPLTGVFDLNLYPTEYIERVEIIPATRAFLYGINSTGGAINLVTKNYVAAKPISRIRFFESAYEHTYFDGFVSQDVKRDLNVTIGLQHPSYYGRFRNSNHEAWNARVKIRYNISENLNIFASEMYNQTRTGLNGGLDTLTLPIDYYDKIDAILRNEDAYEKITRHDVQLGMGGRFFSDSNSITSLTLFHSTNLREYRDENPPIPYNNIFVQQDHWSQWYGARLTHNLSLFGNEIDVGTEFQSRGVIASSVMSQEFRNNKSVWIKDEFVVPTMDLMVSGFGRYEHEPNQYAFASGFDASYQVFPFLNVHGGMSKSIRSSTLQEELWRDSTVDSWLSLSHEQHEVREVGVKVNLSNLDLHLSYSQRTIASPLENISTTYTNPYPNVFIDKFSERNINGLNGKINFRYGLFVAEGLLQYLSITNDGNEDTRYPLWNASGGIYLWDKFFDKHLNIKVGFRGRVVSAHDGVEFNPQAQMYVPSTYWKVKSVGIGDFVLLAHIGDADINLVLENLFGRDYILVPYFPMPDRTLRFGLNWQFLD